MVLVSGPTIARLGMHSRACVFKQIQRGAYGPITRGPGGVLFVALVEVENFYGRKFDQAEIDRAVANQPDRILIVDETEA
jgi:hypothetical protein